MKVFLTGATGFIGTRLMNSLTREGHSVAIIARKPEAVAGLENDRLKILTGDIFNREKLMEGMEECDWVFHLAAYAKPTSVDKDLPYKTNVEGTRNVIESAVASGVKKIVFTSTGGTMGFSRNGMPVDEETNKNIDFHTEYERTKSEAETIARSSSTPRTEVVTVNPTRVFGPGLLSKSNSITRIMKLYCQGIWRIIPGDGSAIGNYAFIDDVVEGHILAAKYGRAGQRYILGGENVSFERLFAELGKAHGNSRMMIKFSASGMKKAARATGVIGSFFGKPALISDRWIDKYLQNWILTSEKAIREIHYRITPFEEALTVTVKWIESGKNGKAK